MDDDDPIASLIGSIAPELSRKLEDEPAVIAPPEHFLDDTPIGPFEPAPMEAPTPFPDHVDVAADLRSRLEFIRKELPPGQRREWMLRLLNQFSDLSEDSTLFGELNDYMRLTQDEDHAAGGFWERTPQAWDHRRGADYEENPQRDLYR